jgi:DNA-directed RNA polymerase specialized sigma24 family protein
MTINAIAEHLILSPCPTASEMNRLATALRPYVRSAVARSGIDTADRDDVMQDILVRLTTTDFDRFDPKRGTFLAFCSNRIAWMLSDRRRQTRREKARCVQLEDGDDDQTPLERLVEIIPDPCAILLRKEHLARMRGARWTLRREIDSTRSVRERSALESALRGEDAPTLGRALGVHTTWAWRLRKRAVERVSARVQMIAA